MRIISYYTIDTPYEREAARLRQSIDKLGIEHNIVGLPSLGSWVENCAQKARFIKDRYEALGGDFWWFDADAELISHPEELSPEKVDLAAPIRNRWNLNSSCVYFGNSSRTAELVELWTGYCETYPFVFDQLLLMFAAHNLQRGNGLKLLSLSDRYKKKYKAGAIGNFIKIAREQLGLREKPIVRQYQASTRLKDAVATKAPGTSGRPIEIGDADCPQHVRDLLANEHSEPVDVEAVVREMVAAKYGEDAAKRLFEEIASEKG